MQQEQPEAEHKAQQSAESKDEPSRTSVGQSIVEEAARDNPKKNYFSKFKDWVSFLTLLFVGAYTVRQAGGSA